MARPSGTAAINAKTTALASLAKNVVVVAEEDIEFAQEHRPRNANLTASISEGLIGAVEIDALPVQSGNGGRVSEH